MSTLWKKIWILIVICLWGVNAQAEELKPPAEPIVGGQEAVPGSWPSAVVIGTDSAYGLRLSCGGTLIRPNWVLSAAHCFVDSQGRPLRTENLTIAIGRHIYSQTASGEELFKIVQVVIHPRYNPSTHDSDIALIRLNKASRKPLQEIFNDSFSLAGSNAMAIGWGLTSETGSLSRTLQEVSVPIVPDSACRIPYPQMTNNMFCAGLKSGGKDTCQGDSGGPLLILTSSNGTNIWQQAGITSFGTGCARPEFYGVYTRVSQFTSWINEIIGATFDGNRLQSGWNLIASQQGRPLSVHDFLAPRNFSSNNQPFRSVWGWNNGTWELYLSEGDYHNYPGFSLLTTIYPQRGYWLHTTREVGFIYSEPPSPETPLTTTTTTTTSIPPTTTTLPGLTVQGLWVSSGGRSSIASGNPRYSFQVSSASTVTVTLASPTIDAYLYLLSGSKIIAEDDDSAGYLNSRITQRLDAGSYLIVAATLSSGRSGSFNVTVQGTAISQLQTVTTTTTTTTTTTSTTTSTSLRPTTTLTGQLQRAQAMLGSWVFGYRIINTFYSWYGFYRVSNQKNSYGEYYVEGLDEYGDLVLVSYTGTGYALLDTSIIIDYFYTFTFSGSQITGCAYLLDKGSTRLGTCYPLAGVPTGNLQKNLVKPSSLDDKNWSLEVKKRETNQLKEAQRAERSLETQASSEDQAAYEELRQQWLPQSSFNR